MIWDDFQEIENVKRSIKVKDEKKSLIIYLDPMIIRNTHIK